MILDIPQSDLPLCPNIDDPKHLLHNQIVNAAYAVTERNEEGESIHEESEKINTAIAYGRFSSRMYAYRSTANDNRNHKLIEAYYFLCPICSFMLPATGVPF